ncbi:MAG: choice-of-anchor D domain-containing protein, partial [bacterium]
MTGKHVLRSLILSIVCLAILVNAQSQQPAEYADNQVIIKIKGGVPPAEVDNIRQSLGASQVRQFQIIGAELWDISGVTVEGAVMQYSGDTRIEYIEPNYIVYADEIFPNDPSFNNLWGLHNTGQTGGTPDADVDAPDAWAVGTGGDIVVGVIDTGVDYLHPDLAANIWTNPGEIPGNGVDDDGNGFVDDIHGWDFVNDDNDPMDDHGHGTHCSGTIAGVGNNGIGVVGVNWSARIMGIKFLSAWGSGTTADAISSVEYATLMGVKVTNNSWGGGAFSQALKDAIEATGLAGGLFVAAAGNSGSNNDVYPHYPSSYDLDNIIAVANTDHNDNMNPGSCFGLVSVDLGAPGTNIYSTLPGNSYGYASGTSMSSPHVTGAVALFWSLYPGTPHLNLKDRILASVDPLPALAGKTVSGGRLNVFMSIAEPDSIPPGPVSDLATSDPTSNSIMLRWTASGDDGSSGEAAYYDVRYAIFPINDSNFHMATSFPGVHRPNPAGTPESLVVDGLDFNTSYYFALRVFDEWGNYSPVSNSPFSTTLGPPQIAVDPVWIGDSLITGAVSVHPLTIMNIGEGTLDFSMPLFEALRLLNDGGIQKNDVSNDFPDIEVGKGEEDPRAGNPVSLGAGGPDGFGYLWIDSDEPGGPTFDWYEISAIGTPLPLSDDDYEEVALPFPFSFYGEEKTSVKVSSNGYLTFGANGTDLTNDPIPSTYDPNDFIAPFWDDLYPPGGSVYYYHDIVRGWFVVEYKNVPLYGSGGSYTFEVILKANGNISFQYLSMDANVNSSTTGIENKDGTDGLQIAFNTSYLHNNLAVSIHRAPEWVRVHPSRGRVWAGESTSVDVTFDATGLMGGSYDDSLAIESNDPDDPTFLVPLFLHVTGASDIAVSDTLLDYGSVFVGRDRLDTLLISNLGSDSLLVTSVTLDHPYFSADTSAFGLGVGESRMLAVTYAPADTGLSLGTLQFTTNDPDESVVSVALRGLGLYPPEIVVYPDSLSETLPWGETRESIITICNQGRSDLEFWISITAAEAANVQVDYFAGDGQGDAPIYTGRPVPLEEIERLRASIPAQVVVQGDGNIDQNDPVERQTPRSAPLTAIHGEEVFGSDEFEYFGSYRSRGNIFFCTVSTNLNEHRLYLNPTTSTQMWFLVYEGISRVGVYSLVSASDVTPAGPGLGWYSSGKIKVPMVAGRYYLICTSFEQGTYYYNEQDISPYPIPASFGTLEAGAGWSWAPPTSFPPLPTLSVPSGAFGGPVAYYQTIVTGVGTAWVSVDPETGTGPMDSCMNVTVVMEALDVEEDDLAATILVESNDPEIPEVAIPARLHVTGVTDIEVSADSLDFGSILIGDTIDDTLVVSNEGTDVLVVDELILDNDQFSADTSGFTLGVDESHELIITFAPNDSGLVEGRLKIGSNDPDEPSLIVALTGRGLIPPEIVLSPGALNGSLYTGGTAPDTLTIKNNGGSDLLFDILEGEHSAAGQGVYIHPSSGSSEGLPDDAMPRRLADPRAMYNGNREPPRERLDPASVRVTNVMGGERRILLVQSGAVVNPIREALLAFPDIVVVDEFNAAGDTPTLSFLMNYHVVIAISNVSFYDPNALGDVLADYVDEGGGVIMTLATFVSGWAIGGRFLAEGYSPFELGYGPVGSSNLGNYDIHHPIMAGVSEAWGGLLADMPMAPGAVWVADWQSGLPFVATKGENVVGVNIFLSDSGYWTGDIPLILHNSVFWCSAGDIPWLTVDPTSGTVPAGHVAEISIGFDARDPDLTGGDYYDSLFVESNDPAHPVVPVPVHLHIKGAPDIAVLDNVLAYGLVYIGQTAIKTLRVMNTGTDSLLVTGITIDNPLFGADPNGFTLGVGDTCLVPVTFTPVSTGMAIGTLTIESNDPDEPSVTVIVWGEGLMPPVIHVQPDSLADSLYIGQMEVHTIAIDNKGWSPLAWTIDAEVLTQSHLQLYMLTAPDPNAVQIEEESGEPAPAGPTRTEPISAYLGDLTGVRVMFDREHGQTTELGWETIIADITARGAEVTINYDPFTPALLDSFNVVWSVDLSISFTSAELAALAGWIQSGGGLLLEGDNTSTVPIYNSILQEINAGIVYSTTDGTTGTTPNIFPHETTEGVNSIYLSANIAHLSTVTGPAGNLVNDLSNVPNSAYSEIGSGRIVAMADEIFEDYRMSQADNQLFANQVFDWLAGGVGWLAVAPASGLIDPGEGEDVEVTLDSEGLIGGRYDATLVVSSNDPVTPELNVPVHMQVQGIPDIVVSDNILEFGTVYIGVTAAETLQVSNIGTDSLRVTGMTIYNPVFSTDPSGFSLGPGDSRTLIVVFAPTDPGAATGGLIITSNDPDESEVLVLLEGNALEPPVISVQPDSLADSLTTGEIATHIMTIDNTGLSPLEWNIRMEIPTGMQTNLYTLTTPDPDAIGVEEESGTPAPPGPVRTEPISAYLQDLTGVLIMFDCAHGQQTTSAWEDIIADLTSRGAEVTVNLNPFTPARLDSFDVVWSVDVYFPLTAMELAALADWIQSGGGLLLEGDNTSTVPIYNSILQEINAGIVYSTTDGTT